MSGNENLKKKAAIVLGGGLKKVKIQDQMYYEPEEQAKERLDKAYALFEEGRVDCIITTGKYSVMASVDPAVVGPQTEAQVGKQYLIAKSTASRSARNIQECIFYEDQSIDTISNAWFAKKVCLEPLGITSCIVVTSDYHIERSRVIFEWVLGPHYTVEYAEAPSHLSERERERRNQFERALTDDVKTHLVGSIAAGDDEAMARFMENEHKKLFSRNGPPFPQPKGTMFEKTAQYYDKFYDFKDYQGEVEKLRAIIGERCRSGGRRLLDVACGTGRHIAHLKAHFEVEGLDLLSDFVATARQRHPEITFHQGDMTDFDLGRRFDVVTCLFSSIGYVKTVDRLHKAVRCMAAHLLPGGLLIVEPWFTPDGWHAGHVSALTIDEPELKLARMNTSMVDGRISYFDLHYLIGTPEGTEHHVERHELGLFTGEEMREAFVAAGLHVSYDEQGLTGRGLYIAQKSKEEAK
ncbi:MAG: YdcF family protein [Anaerolineae bacterium]|nr:YdcF family protein [Anaerolineae bacterium]